MEESEIIPDIPDEVPVGEYAKYWLPGWAYDIMKWAGLLAIPACATAYSGLAAIGGGPAAGEVAQTSAVISTVIGCLLGASEAKKSRG